MIKYLLDNITERGLIILLAFAVGYLWLQVESLKNEVTQLQTTQQTSNAVFSVRLENHPHQ